VKQCKNFLVTGWIVILGLVLGLSSFSEASQRKHKAHDHSSGELNLAFEKNRGILEFELPAMAVIGFEKAPQTEERKKQEEMALLKLAKGISEIVQFAAELQCVLNQESLLVKRSGNHADVQGRFVVQCARPLQQSRIKFQTTSQLPKLKHLKISTVIDQFQSNVKTKNGSAEVEIP
jgi:hypothetical protein